MKKVCIDDLKIGKVIYHSEKSIVYELKDGRILKLYNLHIVSLFKMIGIDYEDKLMHSKPILSVPEIMVPSELVYDGNTFLGYVMDRAKGMNYNDYDIGLNLDDRTNLELYVKKHLQLESIVQRGNKEGFVFPDLCSCDNIFIDRDNMSLIDYDGLQIGKYKVDSISSSLGEQTQYLNQDKYLKKNGLFTSELDKKSLIILFFLMAFNINLNQVGVYQPYLKRKITLDDIFDTLGLEDYDIMNKVWKIFSNNVSNEFLGEDLYRLIDDYQLLVLADVGDNQFIKKLKRI